MKTRDISGNPKGRKPQILGWKWCEGKLLLLVTSYFCRLQPTRGSYLKGSSYSRNFSTGYNPQEAPTSIGHNLFFIVLQHRKGQKSLDHNTKSQMLVTLNTILLPSLLLHCFSFVTLCLLCNFSSYFLCKHFHIKKLWFHSTLYIL